MGSVTIGGENPTDKKNFNSHAPWGAWLSNVRFTSNNRHFNSHAPWGAWLRAYTKKELSNLISTHTLRGERDSNISGGFFLPDISTHTLRGERDFVCIFFLFAPNFNSHAPWGAWQKQYQWFNTAWYFNSHAPWGAWQKQYQADFFCLIFQLTRSVGSVTSIYYTALKTSRFQLTRSVGSVTLHIVYVKSRHHNRADILLKITLKIDIFYIICIIFSANLHIKPISLHVRSQNQTALRVICFLCTYMLHSPLPIIT